MPDNITFEIDKAIGTVTFIREEALNAIDEKTTDELLEVIDEIERNNEVRVLIFKGKGKAFVAGADIKVFEGKTGIEIKNFSKKLQGLFNRIELLPIPVIAAIDGYCLGGGCELAMACDLRIASTRAVFGQPEIRLGLLPGAGGTQRLPRLVGKTFAKELIFLGKNIAAERALNIGLINQVVEPEKLNEEVNKIAELLSKGPRFAIAQAKELIDRCEEMSLHNAIALEANLFSLCFEHEDCAEGVSAFLEKRRANFK